MYIPEAYRAADPAGLVRQYPFALLVTGTGADLQATSTPLYFEHEGDSGTLVGHMARNNPQVTSLVAGMPALAVFMGPHAYISSAWYREKPEVPTWNYVAAHVRGRITPIDDDAGQLAILRHTARAMEGDRPGAWDLEQAPAGRVAFLLPMIRSFRLTVDGIEGATKLSQKHPAGDRLNVMLELLRSGAGTAADLAELMAQA
ncbi:MAG: FMN-binding negative transcriptional regulator [Azospirillaceae bacterium]|nr:FMN-binding negative transcriptional regulator [Azospirillaceae bacterium]